VADAIEKEKEREGTNSTIESVVTLQQFLPKEQQQKLEVLREIFAIIDKRPAAQIPPEIRRLRQKTKLEPVTLSDVPERLTRAFVEKDGHRGRVALVFPTLETNSSNGRAQIQHARTVREAALRWTQRADRRADRAHHRHRAGDHRRRALHGPPQLLRRDPPHHRGDAQPARWAWVIGSLALGVLWGAGAMTALNLKLNFVNFAVLPITFGIGWTTP